MTAGGNLTNWIIGSTTVTTTDSGEKWGMIESDVPSWVTGGVGFGLSGSLVLEEKKAHVNNDDYFMVDTITSVSTSVQVKPVNVSNFDVISGVEPTYKKGFTEHTLDVPLEVIDGGTVMVTVNISID